MKRFLVPLVALLAIAGAVAACSSESDDSGDANFNDADVSFAQGMIPHHEQAVEMAELATDRAESSAVKDLARRIKAAQGPEIAQMRGWLEDWGEPETAEKGSGDGEGHDDDDGGGGHDGGDPMDTGTGMMSAEAMEELRAANGAEFDERFLTMMIEHHEGAVDMARRELEGGEFTDAKELAQAIIDAQEGEIEEMRGLLDGGT